MEDVTVRKMSQLRDGRRGRFENHPTGIPEETSTFRIPIPALLGGGRDVEDGFSTALVMLVPNALHADFFFLTDLVPRHCLTPPDLQ